MSVPSQGSEGGRLGCRPWPRHVAPSCAAPPPRPVAPRPPPVAPRPLASACPGGSGWADRPAARLPLPGRPRASPTSPRTTSRARFPTRSWARARRAASCSSTASCPRTAPSARGRCRRAGACRSWPSTSSPPSTSTSPSTRTASASCGTTSPRRPPVRGARRRRRALQRLEGSHFAGGAFWFDDTAGGEGRHGQVFRLLPSGDPGGGGRDRLELYLESDDTEARPTSSRATASSGSRARTTQRVLRAHLLARRADLLPQTPSLPAPRSPSPAPSPRPTRGAAASSPPARRATPTRHGSPRRCASGPSVCASPRRRRPPHRVRATT